MPAPRRRRRTPRRNAGSPEFVVEVDYAPADGRLRVGVTDTGLGYPIPRTPDEHGRGLQLVALSPTAGAPAAAAAPGRRPSGSS